MATFDIPEFLPTEDKVVEMSLVTDNELDGASVMPSAVFIKQTGIDLGKAQTLWQNSPIENLHQKEGFSFPYRNVLGETIRNLYFHVSLWFAMFILLTGSVVYSIKYLSKGNINDDHRANSLISIAVVYGLLGCATGSVWAKHTWGTWWTTDVKLNMSAVFMLIYLAYFVLRGSFQDEIKKARLTSVYNIFAFASIIPLLFVIPRLVDSLHPGNGGNPGFGLWISTLRYRLAVLADKLLERT